MENNLEPIFQEITKSLEKSREKAFAVFDFDNTCIFNDITEAALDYMSANNLFRDKDFSDGGFEKYYKLFNEGKVKESYEFISKILNGFSINEIGALVEKVIEVGNIKPREKVIELLNYLKTNGVEVWVVSASPEILVRQVMTHFNIEANLIGIRNIIVDGKITPELEKPLPIIEGKVECIKKFISQNERPLLGVGDSINDLPMLEYCNVKAVVSLNNALSYKAKQDSWFLI